MFAKTTSALTVILDVASGALVAMEHYGTPLGQDVYDVRPNDIVSDPDIHVCFELGSATRIDRGRHKGQAANVLDGRSQGLSLLDDPSRLAA